MKIVKINNKQICFFYIPLFLFVIFISVYLGHNFAIFEDDLVYSTYYKSEKIFNCLNFNFGHGGGYLGYFLSKFLSFGLPNLLSIHPCDFTVFHLVIKGFFTIITLLLIAKFSVFFYRSKPIFISVFSFLTFYYFFYLCKLETLIVGVSYNYYRYSFSLIFFSIVVYFIFENLIKNKKITKFKSVLFILLCAFIAGTSSEIIFITLILFLLLILLYQLIIYFISFLRKSPEFLNSYKFNIGKIFILMFLVLSFAVFSFVSSSGFKEVSMARGLSNIFITEDLLQNFINQYIQLYFLYEIVYWILFIILFVINVVIAYKKHEIKKLILPFLLQISILGTIFSLVFCKETYYTGGFWLIHNHIRFIFSMLIMYPMLMFLSYFLKSLVLKCCNSLDKKKIINHITLIIMVFSLILTGLLIETINGDVYRNFYKKIENFKVFQYKLEKVFRFYYLKQEVPYLPGYINYRDIYRFKKPTGEFCFIDNYNNFLQAYYANIYKDANVYSMFYCVSDKAMEKFYENGGTFTEEELKSIKFSRLFDENFVLNKETN